MKATGHISILCVAVSWLLSPALALGEQERVHPPLPEPLTLSDALLIGIQSHPKLVVAQSQVAEAEISSGKVDASYGVNAFVELQPRLSSRAAADNVDFQDDSRYGLVIRKRLTDFGRTESRKEAAQSDIAASQARFVTRLDRHRLEIMRSFFAVILSDHAYRARNERLAIEYFRYSRMAERRDRFEQYSDLGSRSRRRPIARPMWHGIVRILSVGSDVTCWR